jgi:hypothetical protein
MLKHFAPLTVQKGRGYLKSNLRFKPPFDPKSQAPSRGFTLSIAQVKGIVKKDPYFFHVVPVFTEIGQDLAL